GLGSRFELLEDLSRDLGGAHPPPADLHMRVPVGSTHYFIRYSANLIPHLIKLAPHKALYRIDGVLRVGDRLALGDLPDLDLSLVIKRNDRGRRPAALLVDDDFGLFSFHN